MIRKNRVLFLLMAGVVAGWMGDGVAADSAKDAPKVEHYAMAADIDYLDGPRLEALGRGKGHLPATDVDGNLYLVCKYSTCRIRCILADGTIETIAGDDRWPGNMSLTEGPASYLPNLAYSPRAGDYSVPGTLIQVYGYPLKGEEYGCLYLYWPDESPIRIFKNKKQDDRWWFQKLGTTGGEKPPVVVGESAKISELDLLGARIRQGFMEWKGNLYSFDLANPDGEITCMAILSDYLPKLTALYEAWLATDPNPKPKQRRKPKVPSQFSRGEDGVIYMASYWNSPPGGVYRMLPDWKTVEHLVSDNSPVLKTLSKEALAERVKGLDRENIDGPGLLTTWHCGPADITVCGNLLFLHSIDSVAVRRWRDGRVSTLCYDGEWREAPSRRFRPTGGVSGKHHHPGADGKYIYITYPGEERGGDNRILRFGPSDFNKATIGPLVDDKGGRE